VTKESSSSAQMITNAAATLNGLSGRLDNSVKGFKG
jgi:hypothetical protein